MHDNSLWVETGPIDGGRERFTGGIATDLANARFDSWVLSADVRRYLRTSLNTAIALRGFMYLTGGERRNPFHGADGDHDAARNAATKEFAWPWPMPWSVFRRFTSSMCFIGPAAPRMGIQCSMRCPYFFSIDGKYEAGPLTRG